MKKIASQENAVNNNANLANKLIKLRAERNLSQDMVAEMLDVSKSTYCRMEKGATFSADVLQKLLRLYNMTYEQFYNVKLPINKLVIYSPKLINELNYAIEKYGKPPISDSWSTNRERYQKLKEALDPVMKEREEQIEIPDFNICNQMVGQTIITFSFDAYSEWLIDQCIKEQGKLIKAICG